MIRINELGSGIDREVLILLCSAIPCWIRRIQRLCADILSTSVTSNRAIHNHSFTASAGRWRIRSIFTLERSMIDIKQHNVWKAALYTAYAVINLVIERVVSSDILFPPAIPLF